MTDKIEMNSPIVEMDGDEMTRVLWPVVKDRLLKPYIHLKTDYYDLGLRNRDRTADQVTIDAARAIQKYRVGVKCATITPNQQRVQEYGLKKAWKSPNGTIRAILGGTVFRKPVILKNVKPAVQSWEKPIIVGRHAYGDVYRNVEIKTDGPGRAELVFTGNDGKVIKKLIQDLDGPGVLQGVYNTDNSILAFARACFEFAIDQKVDLWFGTKDTISKTYDHNFKVIFESLYEKQYKNKMEAAGIKFFYSLIDDLVARVMKTDGGFLWACKNYDGDVMSDMVASAFGSLAMMTSVLVSPGGCYEYEAAHGTVQRHYYRHEKGEKTSTNSVALIFAWTGALRRRGLLDGQENLQIFADALEETVVQTIQDGLMTADLARIADPKATKVLESVEFIETIGERFASRWKD